MKIGQVIRVQNDFSLSETPRIAQMISIFFKHTFFYIFLVSNVIISISVSFVPVIYDRVII